jgi:hypothetical protein
MSAAQATADSLQRWCLRALHQSCDSMLYNTLHSRAGARPLEYSRHQGPPPLRFSCIAPYCQEWTATGDGRGHCNYQKRFAAQNAQLRRAPRPTVPAGGEIGPA